MGQGESRAPPPEKSCPRRGRSRPPASARCHPGARTCSDTTSCSVTVDASRPDLHTCGHRRRAGRRISARARACVEVATLAPAGGARRRAPAPPPLQPLAARCGAASPSQPGTLPRRGQAGRARVHTLRRVAPALGELMAARCAGTPPDEATGWAAAPGVAARPAAAWGEGAPLGRVGLGAGHGRRARGRRPQAARPQPICGEGRRGAPASDLGRPTSSVHSSRPPHRPPPPSHLQRAPAACWSTVGEPQARQLPQTAQHLQDGPRSACPGGRR